MGPKCSWQHIRSAFHQLSQSRASVPETLLVLSWRAPLETLRVVVSSSTVRCRPLHSAEAQDEPRRVPQRHPTPIGCLAMPRAAWFARCHVLEREAARSHAWRTKQCRAVDAICASMRIPRSRGPHSRTLGIGIGALHLGALPRAATPWRHGCCHTNLRSQRPGWHR